MKWSRIIVFLSILLLCGTWLSAANNSKALRLKTQKKEKIEVEIKKNLEFVPGTVLL